MRAFVVRPFGRKVTGSGACIDFDAVERLLIAPALARAGCVGTTTAELLQAGNIRADMFAELLKADLVVADISIHNANVFYELGVRHALRDRRTFLLACRADTIPFDLSTDRYFAYDADDPAASVDRLAAGLVRTCEGDAADSPVFQLVPALAPQDWTRCLVVPADFMQEVEAATRNGFAGDLAMLAEEVQGLDWEIEGLRACARRLVRLSAWDAARETWQRVLRIEPAEVEAFQQLATIHQRLGDLTRSDLAIEQALRLPGLAPNQVAELLALRGSNGKQRWLQDWRGAPDLDARRDAALASSHLMPTIDAYVRGVEATLEHYYSGLNALALLTVAGEIARARPATWTGLFDDDAQAGEQLAALDAQRAELAAVVGFAIRVARDRAARANEADPWADVSWADYQCLVLDRPQAVARHYGDALCAAPSFSLDAVGRQLRILADLGVRVAGVEAARARLDALGAQENPMPEVAIPGVLLFTGHMIDDADRAPPRFPAACEGVARDAIRKAVHDEVGRERRERGLADGAPVPLLGLAGAASGGDILFHEACEAEGVPTQLLLALPVDAFCAASVQRAGPSWVERYRRLVARLPLRCLAGDDPWPRWLAARADYNVWARSNLWSLYNAMAMAGGASRVTLLALWDGAPGDAMGGTADMVRRASARGARFLRLDTQALFAPAPSVAAPAAPAQASDRVAAD